MTNPNPEEFAKSILWQLASVQADVYETQLLVVEILAKLTGIPAKEIQQKWKAETEASRERHYREALKRAGLHAEGPTWEHNRPD